METNHQRGDIVDRRHDTLGVPRGVSERRVTASGRRATDAMKMACPYCGSSESAVVRSRGAIAADLVRRRRECADCGAQFPTSETVDHKAIERERGDRDRLKFKIILPPGSQN